MKPFNQERGGVIVRPPGAVGEVIEARAASRPTQDRSAMQPAATKPLAQFAAEQPLAIAAEVDIARPAGQNAARGAGSSLQTERDAIVKRVAAFRNLQIRIKQDREQYCDAVLAKARAALGTAKPSRS